MTLKLRSRVRSPAEVEDARQETFRRVLTTLKEKGGLASAESLGAFVNSVCNNVLFELYRSSARAQPLPEDHDPVDERRPSAETWCTAPRRGSATAICRKAGRSPMTHAKAVDTHAAERYLFDEMPEIERYAFEEHFFDCAECAEDVRTGGLMREGVRAGLLPQAVAPAIGTREVTAANTPAAAGPRSSSWRASTLLPWAVAATLAMAVGYQQWWVVPGLQQQRPISQALSPVTLRSATRGAEPTVARPSTGVVAFAIDLAGVPAGTRLSYDLRAVDGGSVASGAAVAPPPGRPCCCWCPPPPSRLPEATCFR